MLAQKPPSSRKSSAFKHLIRMIEEDVLICRSIGEIGVSLITDIARKKIDGEPVNILTHCNAGWLAAVDWGTALSPIYLAHKLGCNIHVWVSETRPRNQGSSLTSWELSSKGVSHTIIVDNAAGHLMKNGMIDMCIVGADRVTNSGDVCNKIGTYMKALSAFDNNIPFYVATPFSSIDWSISDGFSEISIEKRSDDEVLKITGLSDDGKILHVNLAPKLSHAVNYGFDITPAKLVCGLITQFGIFEASRSGLNKCLRAGKEIDQ